MLLAEVRRAVVSRAVVAAVYVLGTLVSWRKWGALIVDGGRELTLPLKLLEGGKLYGDVRYYYGPIAPWLNEVLYRCFGARVETLSAAGLVVLALEAVLIFELGRRLAGHWVASAAASAFVAICGFGHLLVNPSFNFVLPYTFAATYGILAGTGSVLALVVHVRRPAPLVLATSVVLAVVAALSKLETLLPAALAHGGYLGCRLARRRVRGPELLTYGLGALSFVGVLGALAASRGPTLWQDNLLGLVNAGSTPYAERVAGLAQLTRMAVREIESLAFWASLIALAALAGWYRGWVGPSIVTRVVPLLAALAAGGVSVLVAPGVAFRAVPWLLLGALVSAVLARRRGSNEEAWLPEVLLWLFGVGAVARIALDVRAAHYGFYLLPPAFLGVAVAFARLPELVPRLPATRQSARAVIVGALVGLSVAHGRISVAAYARHTVRVDGPRGAMLLRAPSSEPQAIDLLRTFPPTTRAVAVPEGAGLIFIAGLQYGDGMFSYLPMEFGGHYSDEATLARWAANPPDVFVWVRHSLAEFGSRGFGSDYAQKSAHWIFANYRPVNDPRAPIVVFERIRPGNHGG